MMTMHARLSHTLEQCDALTVLSALCCAQSERCWRSPTGLLFADPGNTVHKEVWQMLDLGMLLHAEHYTKTVKQSAIFRRQGQAIDLTCAVSSLVEPCTCPGRFGRQLCGADALSKPRGSRHLDACGWRH